MILYLYIVGIIGNVMWHINEHNSISNMPTASVIWSILHSILWPVSIPFSLGLNLINEFELWRQKKTRK